MSQVLKVIEEQSTDKYEAAKMLAMVRGYYRANSDWLKQCKLLSIEKHLESKLVNLDTGRTSPKYSLHGYIDKILWHPTDGMCLSDHKTTSEDVGNPNNRYWRRLDHDPQSTTYLLLAMANGIDIDTVLWDIVKKPSIRPKQLSKDDIEGIRNGVYAGRELGGMTPTNEEALEAIAPGNGFYASGDPKRIEGPYLYGLRVEEWCGGNAKEIYFRKKVTRTEEDVYDLNQSVWGVTRILQWCERNGVWPQNFRSCFNFGRQCDYYDVCHGCTPLSEPNFVHRERKDTYRLSHSSAGTFFACPRMYKYRYVDCQVPPETDDDNLRVGSLWHAAMDALFEEVVEKSTFEEVLCQAT